MGAVADVLSSPGHPEVVERILEFLDHRSILSASATCVNINDVVIGSSRVQFILRQALYALPSTYAQFAPRIPVGTLVDRLADTQRRWAELQPKRIDVIEPEPEMFRVIATQGILVTAHYCDQDKPRYNPGYATSESSRGDDDDDDDDDEDWDEDMDSPDSDEDDEDDDISVEGHGPIIDVLHPNVPMDDGAEGWETDDSDIDVEVVDDDNMFDNDGWSTGSDSDSDDEGLDDVEAGKSWTVYDVGLLREADPAVKLEDAVPHWTFKTDAKFNDIAASRNGNVVAVNELDIEDTQDDQGQPNGARIVSTIHFYVLVPNTPGDSSEPMSAIPHPTNDLIQWTTYSTTPVLTPGIDHTWAAMPYYFHIAFGRDDTIVATSITQRQVKVFRWKTGELLYDTDIADESTLGRPRYIPAGEDLLLLGKRPMFASELFEAMTSKDDASKDAAPSAPAKRKPKADYADNVETEGWTDEEEEDEGGNDDLDMDTDSNALDTSSDAIQLLLYTQAGGAGVGHEGEGSEWPGKPYIKHSGSSGALIHAVGDITFPVEAYEFDRPGPQTVRDDVLRDEQFSQYEVPYLNTSLQYAMDDSDGRLLVISTSNEDELMSYSATIRYDELRKRLGAATAPLAAKDWADLVHWDEWLWSDVHIATTGLRVALVEEFEARRRSDVRGQQRVTLRVDDVRWDAARAVGVHPSPLGSRFAPAPEVQALTTTAQSTTLERGGEARFALSAGWDVSRRAGDMFKPTLLTDPENPEFWEAEMKVEMTSLRDYDDRYGFGELEVPHLARKSAAAELVYSKHLGVVVGVQVDADHMYLNMRRKVVVLSF
ncbi:hypothetical protein Q8F55_002446 [Vanrija albida]|uniref:F-box domain-containing protein n=1 Tax=Vanrija albida TaxID=181172 RepID=A0ABR3Q9Z7_9TREE